MRLLDKIVQAVLAGCMVLLAGYIILRGVTIAGENGMFGNSPLLSAAYRKIEEWTTGTVIPVLSYIQEETEYSPEKLPDFLEDTFPLTGYARDQKEKKRAVESTEEYELIMRAEAAAEENKRPRETEKITEKYETENETDRKEKAGEEGTGESGTDKTGEGGMNQDGTESGGSYREELYDYEYLLNHYFSMDVTTTIDSERLNGEKLLSMDMTMQKDGTAPQILIYHTHSQEAFADSVEGDPGTTIVGVGDYLAQILTERYGYQVIHEKGVFDLVDGVLDRNLAYNLSEEAVTEILEQYPSIEVIIDLHRDGVDGTKFVTEYQGKPAAKLMYIVGMSRTADNMDIPYLPNPYIEENLSFALQLQLMAEEEQMDLMRNIYLMAYRFNMHLRPKSLLLEAGTQLNTVEEEKNAMEAFAALLDKVLSGE